ncbi:MAG: sigma-54-dependent Fis family transcriptional regulator [Candidatus Hydrogenedentes bacterium]|nr:sigma-54-dependent Fis family transcriptional regulator [Candidatus Hydrogenedentota bacterium]
MALSADGRVLMVCPEAALADRLYAGLSERGYPVDLVDEGEKAYNQLARREYPVLITVLEHPRVDGFRIWRRARERNPEVCTVFIVSRSEIERATEAMSEGVYDFQLRPVNVQRLIAVIERGLAHQQLVLRQMALQQRVDSDFGLGRLLGKSRQMLHVYNAVRQTGPLESPVMLLGEAGTGKSLLAQALHNNSPRRDAPFVGVDATMLAPGSAADFFFGRQGRFEAADGGTLYLEGLSELPPPLQERIWEVIGSGQFERSPDGAHVPVDVRLIAGDVPRIRRRVEVGDVHRGLYEVLSGALIEIPPLRHRQEDIPLLVQEFLSASTPSGGAVPSCPPEVMDALVRYPWPENVSELRQVVEGMIRLHRGAGPIGMQCLPLPLRQEPEAAALSIAVGTPLEEVERRCILAALAACGDDKKQCAKQLGIGLRTLYRKLEAYGGQAAPE